MRTHHEPLMEIIGQLEGWKSSGPAVILVDRTWSDNIDERIQTTFVSYWIFL